MNFLTAKQSTSLKWLIIDFDSTFIKTESLDELAKITISKGPKNNQIIRQFQQITALGMEGKLGFEESIKKRLTLLKANKSHLDILIPKLKKQITKSVLKNKKFFLKNSSKIYLISGGFKEIIYPIVSSFGIYPENILANSFVYDQKGDIVGFDATNPLSTKAGKAKAVAKLRLDGEVVIIGDGYTDYEVKFYGAADKFVAFIENVERKSVVEKADYIAKSFNEIIRY